MSEPEGTYHTPTSGKGKVDHRITLFAKPIQLSLFFETEPPCNWSAEVYGDSLPHKGPEDDVVGEEGEVEIAFLVPGVIGGRRGYPV